MKTIETIADPAPLSAEQRRTVRRVLGAAWYAGCERGMATMVMTVPLSMAAELCSIVPQLDYRGYDPIELTAAQEEAEDAILRHHALRPRAAS